MNPEVIYNDLIQELNLGGLAKEDRDSILMSLAKSVHKELWYVTECGFKFPVPIEDVGTGVFAAEDKAVLFMRWIRKQREMLLETAVK
jgi:hypothetical protein